MGKIVEVKKDELRFCEEYGYGYLVRYKEAKDIFSKMSDEVITSIMDGITLAFYLTHCMCHEVISSERIYKIGEYMTAHPELVYYRWEGCTFSA